MRFWPTREKRRKLEEDRQRAVDEDVLEEQRRRALANSLVARGWHASWHFIGHPHPSHHQLVEVTRDGEKIDIVNWNSLPPAVDIYGLWWRPHEGQMRGTIIEATASEVPANQLQIPSATGKERENE